MANKKRRILLGLALLSLGAASCKPACPISSCQVRMVHPHGEREYRGQPIWKKQNPKMGEKMKKVSKERQHGGRSNARNKK